MLSSCEIILNRTIVLFYFICFCSPGRASAGRVIPRPASVRRDLDRGTWHRGFRSTSESAARSRLNDSVEIAAPDWGFQLKGLATGVSTSDQLNDRLRLKNSGFATISSTIPLGRDQHVDETRYHEDDNRNKYSGRFENTVEYLQREVNDPQKHSDQWTATTTKNYERNSRIENLDLKALLHRDQKGKTVRKKGKRETTDVDFRCVNEGEAEQLRDLWRKNRKSTAALEYIEMGWDNARSGTCPANCTMRLNYEAITQDTLSATFRQQTIRVWQTTNTLANVFQLRDEGSNMVKNKVIVNLLKGLVSSDVVVSGATVAILKDSPDDGPLHPVILAVYRTTGVDQLSVENLTRREASGDERDHEGWFRDVTAQVRSSTPSQDSTLCNLESQVLFETMTLDQTSLASSRTFGIWGLPVFDCAALKTWTLHYAVPLFGCGPEKKLALRGALKVDFDLAAVDINQCNSDGPFSGSHRCPEKSQCVPLSAKGFHRGSYQCQCQSGLFPSNATLFVGSFLETGHVRKTDDRGEYGDLVAAGFGCLPCKSDCELCRDTTPCLVEYDILIRGIPMGIESLCITIGIALTVAIIRLRKTKVMKASFWCLLEIITVGSLLLHATVIIQYFEPTELSCLFIPWLREVGFAIVYGALVLKVYRVLAEFQSRKAHRVQVRDKDLFKYLCCIVVVVIGYMAAWTAVTIDQGNGRTTLLQHSYTSQHLKYTMCQSTWWDYVVEVGEFLFMAFSIYICYRARSAPSNYGEVRLITLAIYNETLVSAAFYITRHFLLFAIHPDYLFLMYFIRCQLTVSITMILILGPKIWYSHQPPDESTSRSRAFSSSDAQENLASPAEVVKLNTTLNPNGDVEIGEINLADMNPEDIRAELKRLYTQLQIYKTKTMRQDNPHISKRRGGRKQTHRRFSLQPFHSKHRHHQCSEHGEHGSTGGGVPGGETEISRTPEESTNSAEGVSIYMDESSVAETTARVPTVTFKSGNKAK